MRKYILIGVLSIITMAACTEQQSQTENKTKVQLPAPPKREKITYHIIYKSDSSKKMVQGLSPEQQKILIALNRTDMKHLPNMDSIIVPDQYIDYNQYCPFPYKVDALADVYKMVFFSYPAQVFAAYENGRLAKWGQTNMGREKDQTPTGLYYANWKAEETQSTFDDEWILKWNFNIENKEGIGWHQYDLPGYPASHSCLRMTEEDAKYMYEWADQWVLEGTENVKAKGTPVIVFGTYPFGQAKPWMALAQNPDALLISEEAIANEAQAHLQTILAEQQKRQQYKQD